MKMKKPLNRANSEDVFGRKYKTAIRAYQNYMEGLHLMLQEKEDNIMNILHQRSSPLWYQELTDQQCAVCDRLLDAIADDMDERTVNRSKGLLRSLGVFPLCPSNIVRTALILCNRNDISFLWTLLELHYMRREDAKATSSSPMNYSINERLLLSAIAHLDMMTTLRGLDKILPTKVPTGELKSKGKKATGAPGECQPGSSPYLQRRQTVKKTGYTVPVRFQPHKDEFLERYERYRDPEYVIRNEATRWFARYDNARQSLSSGEEPFASSSETETGSMEGSSPRAIAQRVLDGEIRDLIKRVDCCQLLCPKHHALSDDSSTRAALMEAVEAVRTKWAAEEQPKPEPHEHVSDLLKHLIDKAVTLAILDPANDCTECRQRYEMQEALLRGETCVCLPEDNPPVALLSASASKGRYFRFQDWPVPFKFDYREILGPRCDTACPIKDTIRRAFDLHASASGSTTISEGIERIVKMTWKEESNHWNEQMEENRRLAKNRTIEPRNPLDVNDIDTKNSRDLKELLKRALHELAKNPKYILATFPDVHKLPLLVAWIRQRYACPISPEERRTALLASRYFWEYLIPHATSARWPVRDDAGYEEKVNWNYKQKLEAKVKTLMNRYYRRLKKVDIQEGRLWWASMVPYHAGPDRFRRTFYAYFPNCEPKAVPLVRPWRTN
ncbi:uncharacterized protein LOC126575601 [Anopheles aquasalis]|uniref:uncharacterized protein LOC126575601 n=1 Tax=Anopheles aquasalis TaxID=42839 RepID=UPI00215B6EA6|nr:uncharacterized protein LOC126575601 [Anopheles aquasalis]